MSGTRHSKRFRSWDKEPNRRTKRSRRREDSDSSEDRDDFRSDNSEDRYFSRGGRAFGRARNRYTDEEPPAGVIFMCSSLTKTDCFKYRVFGLPLSHRDLVERIVPGTKLFLFDFDLKELYGVFEAVSFGGLDLEPDAYRDFEGSYPAQVLFDVYRECLPLTEDIFRDAIRDNYYSRNKFEFELSAKQVSRLTQLFCPIEPPRRKTGRSGVRAIRSPPEGQNLIRTAGVHQYTKDFPDGRLPLGDPALEDFRGLSKVHPSRNLSHTQGFTSSEKHHADEMGFPSRAYGTGLQFGEPGSFNKNREGNALHTGQGKIPCEEHLPNAINPLEPSQMREVDQLALKYVQNDPGFHGSRYGQVSVGGSSDGMSTISLGAHKDYGKQAVRMPPLSGTHPDASYGQFGLQQELRVRHPGHKVVASQAASLASQDVGRRHLKKSRWDQGDNMQAAQLAASGRFLGPANSFRNAKMTA